MFVFFWHRTAPDQCFMFCNFTAPQKSELLTGSCTLVQTKKTKKKLGLKSFSRLRNGPRWGVQGGPGSPWVHFFFSYYIVFYFYIWVFFQNLRPLSSDKFRQFYPNSNYPTQKLNKNNKIIHNDDCIFAGKNYFTTKEQKNHILLKKLKLIFLQLQ